MESPFRAALLLGPLVIFLCTTRSPALPGLEWQPTDAYSGRLLADGEVLLEVRPPTLNEVAIYGDPAPWVAEEGRVEFRRIVREDTLVMHAEPLLEHDIVYSSDVTIAEWNDRSSMRLIGVMNTLFGRYWLSPQMLP